MEPNNSETAGTSNPDRSWVTLGEILKEQEELEAESDAVLGGSDEKNCTYSRGYIGRQALYACMTCMPESRVNEEKRTGVCLACSYQCHEGHDLIELYTKRNFRCDCGGKRMPDVRCKLDPLKIEENTLNLYNQNFSGTYCTCHRPYPDPEDNVEDEMIQCVVCEDWYHTRHLGTDDVPNTTKDFAEMICEGCVQRVGFLRNYVGKIEDGNQTQLNDTVQVDVTGIDESNVADTSTVTVSNDESKAEGQTADADCEPSDAKRVKLDICTKPPYDEGESGAYKKGATFWNEGWRNFLCRCTDCTTTYKTLKVEFLLDEKDTVQWYEEHGRQKQKQDDKNTDDQAMEAFNKMGRVQQVEFLTGINHMQVRLKEFLDTFVTNHQVVTEKDVHEFFAKLKKERSETVGAPSHFCR
ncbi:AAEL007701-PA [Aedes aegypti]|uniref:Putative E3 ubiquitin-protein ligase UBR7 n=1 Tax=Aedes aegypti TaxID=7159 RepID=Q171B0_AEDAE|nr:AAEL007701-PA [Aedes aegypti]